MAIPQETVPTEVSTRLLKRKLATWEKEVRERIGAGAMARFNSLEKTRGEMDFFFLGMVFAIGALRNSLTETELAVMGYDVPNLDAENL